MSRFIPDKTHTYDIDLVDLQQCTLQENCNLYSNLVCIDCANMNYCGQSWISGNMVDKYVVHNIEIYLNETFSIIPFNESSNHEFLCHYD